MSRKTVQDPREGPKTQASELLDVARDCARRGRAVFPVGRAKKPLTEHGFKDATTDEITISRFGGRAGCYAGIATPTGPNWFVLDAHQRRKRSRSSRPSTARSRPRWRSSLPDRACTATCSGKGHEQRQRSPNGLNVRGSGGYVLLPPSPHENGERRRVANRARRDADRASADVAAGVLTRCSTTPAAGEHHPPVERVPHGQRHPYLADFAVRLLRGGITRISH